MSDRTKFILWATLLAVLVIAGLDGISRVGVADSKPPCVMAPPVAMVCP